MYSTTNKPEHVHRMKQSGGLEGSSSGPTGKKGSSSMGEKMEHLKEKMGMKK
jgi:hypothetical protein